MECEGKSRLEEFKHFLNYSIPSVVLLSETHWNDSFNVQFSSYNAIKKDRSDRRGGSNFDPPFDSTSSPLLTLDNFHSIEAAVIKYLHPPPPHWTLSRHILQKATAQLKKFYVYFSAAAHLSSVVISMHTMPCGNHFPTRIEKASPSGQRSWNYLTSPYSHL